MSKPLQCSECPYYNTNFPLCQQKVAEDALDLINRQKAEIDKLYDLLDGAQTSERERFDDWEIHSDKIKEHYAQLYEDAVDDVRAETINEFAERLKSLAYASTDWSHGEHPYVVEVADIDNVIEEMADGE